eukprot:TRINITY_DN12486_c0_g1_i1.p1 TRINITY_DN12486_c0_g1~~TRINITY_DN12486_c0_g1_i1.p1  ORF type:complete len:227 (-),score=22.29 TRINITY_DN12486_c0_g1_i1:593-1273(-)
MSSYLKKEHYPCIFIPTISEFAIALEEFVGLSRDTFIPLNSIEDRNYYVYSDSLFIHLMKCLAEIYGTILTKSPVIFAKTELTEYIFGSIVETVGLRWNFVYKSSQDRKSAKESNREVSIDNLLKYTKSVKVILDKDIMDGYVGFLIAETKYLKEVKKTLKSKKSSYILTEDGINKPKEVLDEEHIGYEVNKLKSVVQKMREWEANSKHMNTNTPDINETEDFWTI